MNNKNQIKLIIPTLKEAELFKLLDSYLAHSGTKVERSVKQISYKCFECTCKIKNRTATGYGRNETESVANCVRNLMEIILEDDKAVSFMRSAFKKMGYIGFDGQMEENIVSQYSSVNNNRKQPLQPKAPLGLNSSVLNNSSISKNSTDSLLKSKLKQDIFEQLNLDNLKIANPNLTMKTKTHESYLSQSVSQEEDPRIRELLKANEYIQELEKLIKQAVQQNLSLKASLEEARGELKKKEGAQNIMTMSVDQPSQLEQSQGSSSNMMVYSTKNMLAKNNRSISVENKTILSRSSFGPSASQNNNTSIHQVDLSESVNLAVAPKRMVPRLNLEVLPNYHGKSNKSLNQSLLEAYQKKLK